MSSTRWADVCATLVYTCCHHTDQEGLLQATIVCLTHTGSCSTAVTAVAQSALIVHSQAVTAVAQPALIVHSQAAQQTMQCCHITLTGEAMSAIGINQHQKNLDSII
jgi:hypothetical protein